MTQGQPLPKDRQLKQKFINEVVKAFYENPQLKTSQELLSLVKTKFGANKDYTSYIEQLSAHTKDDKYHIFTLSLKNSPTDIEFRLKKADAYGGPKTENYLDRIDLRIEAALKYIEARVPPSEQEALKKYIQHVGDYIKYKIETECALSPYRLQGLKDNQHEALEHFEQQHERAKKKSSYL